MTYTFIDLLLITSTYAQSRTKMFLSSLDSIVSLRGEGEKEEWSQLISIFSQFFYIYV